MESARFSATVLPNEARATRRRNRRSDAIEYSMVRTRLFVRSLYLRHRDALVAREIGVK
jgi:hypothetical protein